MKLFLQSSMRSRSVPSKTIGCSRYRAMTGNTTSKLANAMTDKPVLMAAKAQMRNQRPLVLAISTNDGLGLKCANIAKLMFAKNIYFVPFGQDNPFSKAEFACCPNGSHYGNMRGCLTR